MGKGNRNRENHLSQRTVNTQKVSKKNQKKVSEWLPPIVALVIVVALIIGVAASLLVDNGFIKRGRVLVESKTGKFDVNQQMATYIAWNSQYQNAYYYYYYCQMGIYQDTTVTSTYKSAADYALSAAQYATAYQLRDSVDDAMNSILTYVAVADAAWKAGVRLDDKDKESVNAGIEELGNIQTSLGYTTLNGFLNAAMGGGMKKGDVKDALELMAMYNKYATMIQVDFEEAATLADITKFRDENPGDYFKVDYLTYEADTKEFADKLMAEATNAEEFKQMVLTYHAEKNYKDIYNQLTTHKEAADLLSKIQGKTDANESTALSDALDEIGAGEKTDYNKDDEELNEDLSTWLFNTSRKQYDTATVATDDGIYVIAFLSASAATGEVKTVSARSVFVAFEEGNTYGEGEKLDDKFKENILTYISESKKDEPSYPDISKFGYQMASDQASDFEKLVKAEGADIAALMEEYDGVKKTGVTSSTAESVLPTAIRNEVVKSTVEVNDILKTSADNVHYVIYVTAIQDSKVDLTYASFEGDLYYQIINSLTAEVDEVYPKDTAANYKADAEKDTFEAWISELTEGEGFASARQEFDKKYFEKTVKEEKVWNVYMAVKNEKATDSLMYLDTTVVVNGGYLLFDKDDHAGEAAKALETLKGNNYTDLLNALTALDSKATTSVIKADDESLDKNLKEWLFSDARTEKNTVGTVTNAAGNGTYVAVFVEKSLAWENSAKTAYVTDQMQKWAEELSADYAPRQKALNKLGEPTTTQETTAATTASDTAAIA